MSDKPRRNIDVENMTLAALKRLVKDPYISYSIRTKAFEKIKELESKKVQ